MYFSGVSWAGSTVDLKPDIPDGQEIVHTFNDAGFYTVEIRKYKPKHLIREPLIEGLGLTDWMIKGILL